MVPEDFGEYSPLDAMSISNDVSDDQFTSAILSLFDHLNKHNDRHLPPSPDTQARALVKRQELEGSNPLVAKSVHDIWAWSLPMRKDV